MTDRELLELAAKAAGIPLNEFGDCENGDYWIDEKGTYWNPLDDDGDAFRLAVKLGFAVSVEFQVGSTVVLWGPPTGVIREQHGDDPCAATRMAIVRAAAEIGKEIP